MKWQQDKEDCQGSAFLKHNVKLKKEESASQEQNVYVCCQKPFFDRKSTGSKINIYS
jgi:hypothetical protein